MKTFHGRRWRNWILVTTLGAIVLATWWIHGASPFRADRLTGWTLLGLVVILLAYNLRKKLPFLPLGSSSTWLQWHLYFGSLAVLVFFIHLSFSRPNGWLESALALVFVVASVSGALGIWMSRVLARRLTARGESVLYERIGSHCRDIRQRVEELVLQSVTESNTTTIAAFYSNRLVLFFDRPHHFWSHLAGSMAPRQSLLREFSAMRRYLRERELQLLDQLEDLARVKDDLDYQYAAQSALKWWLFVHIPAAYLLLLLALVHVALVYAFSGG